MNFLFAGYGWDSDLTCCITLGYSWHTKKYKNTEFFLTADLGSSLSTVLKNNAQFFFFYHITVLILKCICVYFILMKTYLLYNSPIYLTVARLINYTIV